jgi:hypothetical protein
MEQQHNERDMDQQVSGSILSTILKHDRKQNSYKIALLRAINDVVLSFPEMRTFQRDVAVPLSLLASYWVAYYWAFVDPQRPIMQGNQAKHVSGLKQDMSFRRDLTELRTLWEQDVNTTSAADGFFLVHELRIPRKQATFSRELVTTYNSVIRKVKKAIRQPIQYAGPGQWEIFAPPNKLSDLADVVAVPGTALDDDCLVISADLWQQFRDLSLWIEALCIHEWSLFSETVTGGAERGMIYHLLTERPDNRRPLTWERNQVDLLLMEGAVFTCPWTQRSLRQSGDYHLDHLVPISLYPVNELWNLVPVDARFNIVRGNLLPSEDRLATAWPHFVRAYNHYLQSTDLAAALHEDVAIRFVLPQQPDFPEAVANAAADFIQQMSATRNIARF